MQLHSSPGIGNGVGALYQAKRGNSPLVVIGGDAGIKYAAMDAQMAADLVGMTRPVTKWATVVQHPSSLLRILRRAIKIAATPPMGPVYVCLPQDILDAPAEEPVRPTSIPSTRIVARAVVHRTGGVGAGRCGAPDDLRGRRRGILRRAGRARPASPNSSAQKSGKPTPAK